MRIRTRISLLIGAATFAVGLLLILFLVQAFRSYTLESEHNHGAVTAERLETELLARLGEGAAIDRKEIEASLRATFGALDSLHFAPTPAVLEQFDVAASGALTELERHVVETGASHEEIVVESGGVFFRYVAPIVADGRCVSCHDVPAGTALGATTIRFDMTHERERAEEIVARIVVALILFAVLVTVALRRAVLPVVETATAMRTVIGRAQRGDFSRRLGGVRDDELGQLAEETNNLLAALENGFGRIVREVESLHHHRADLPEENMLDHTVESIRILAASTRFKQTLENDPDLAAIYARLRQLLWQEFGFERFTMYEHDAKAGKLRVVFHEDGETAPEPLRCDPAILERSALCRACRTADEVRDPEGAGICPSYAGRACFGGERGYVCLPVIWSGRVVGVLQLIVDRDADAARLERAVTALRTFLHDAAPVIESKRLNEVLRQISLHDPLTELYNRRFLEQFSDKLVSQATRRGSGVALLMCDLDHFKETNDTYGHEAGDEVLAETARMLLASVRLSDYVVRFGGEEFLAVLPDAAAREAVEVAERVRQRLERFAFRAGGAVFAQTISIGVAVFPDDAGGFREAVACADRAMYVAKQRGRNRVVRYRGGPGASS